MIIKAEVGNILNQITNNQLDDLMNTANGISSMGRGIAGANFLYVKEM